MIKPSDRIKQLCKDICARVGAHQPTKLQLHDAMPAAIAEYLDEAAVDFDEAMKKLMAPPQPAPAPTAHPSVRDEP